MESPILSSPESVSTASVANETSGEGRRGGLPPRGGTAERRRHGKSPSAKSKLTDISALTSSVFGDSEEDNDDDADEESTKVPSEDDEEEEVEMNTGLLFSRTWKLSVSRSLVALKLSRSAILKSLNSSSQSKANNLSCTCTQSKLPYLASGEEGKSCVTSLTLISCNVKEKEKCAVALGSLSGSLICLSRGSGKFSKIIVNCLKHLESSFDPKPVKFSSHVLMKATGIWSGNNNNSPITLTWGSSYVIKKAGLDDVSVTVAKDFFDKFKKHVERPERVVEAMEEWVEKEIGVNLKHFNLVKASSSHNLASSVGTCKIKKWADLVALLEGVEGVEGAEDRGGGHHDRRGDEGHECSRKGRQTRQRHQQQQQQGRGRQ
ncbi:hypothetical protein TL16_g00916 [Triparma laevis f. inornata]|uniref:Uncharacterized protein n=1 Tax=Triparma laevis f. inornata TaxID=1714386 RepID=A0A9W7DP75_9STRA|nr:hypothetical protein TL16_g00916 [Triparma laevis f. inornata]